MTDRINIEFKARCADPEKIRQLLCEDGARKEGTDLQTDTYFKVPRGRLKLREGNIENHLIYYERTNEKGLKRSNVILHKTLPRSPLKEILDRVFGTLVTVRKEREIYYLQNVKFHIDRVEGLGSFVEVEAAGLDQPGEPERLRADCDSFYRRFGIKEEDLVSVSYSDLLLKEP